MKGALFIFLSIVGAVFVIFFTLGATTGFDFHVYFGPDASEWHAELAKKGSKP